MKHSLWLLIRIFFAITVFWAFSSAAQTESGKSYLRFRMIKVSSPEIAEQITQRFRLGETFQRLARQYSQASTAITGGELPWQRSDSIPPVFAGVLSMLANGEISAPVALQGGFYLLQKVDEKSASDYRELAKSTAALNTLLGEIEANLPGDDTMPAKLDRAAKLNDIVREERVSLQILNFRGIRAAATGNTGEAVGAFQAMSDAAALTGNRQWQCVARRNLGQIYKDSGDFSGAITQYDSALVIAREIQDVETEEIALGMLGQIYETLQQFPKAISYYNAALETSRTSGNRRNAGRWFGNLGQIYSRSGDYLRSLAHLDSAISYAQRANQPLETGAFLSAKAHVLLAKGEATAAIALLKQSLIIAREGGDRYSEGMQYGGLGQAYKTLGKIDSARAFFEQAQQIADETQQISDDGLWLGSLGQIFNATGNYAMAIEYFENALQIARQNADRSNEIVWLASIGQVYETVGDFQRALSYFDSAGAITRATGDLGSELYRLGNLGEFYFANDNLEEALKIYREALQIARRLGVRSQEQIRLGSIGQVFQQLLQPEKAVAYYDSALAVVREIGDVYNEGIWLGSKGLVLRSQEQFDAAIEHFNRSLEIARSVNDKESIWRQYWNLAATYAKIPGSPRFQVVDMFDNAVNALKEIAGDLVNFSQKRNYLEVQNKQQLYDDFIAYLMRLPEKRYHEKALEISEASRNRALKDLLQGQQLEAQLSIEARQAATRRTESLFDMAGAPVLAVDDGALNRFRSSESALLEAWAAGIAIPARTPGSTETAPDLGLREIQNEARQQKQTLLIYHILSDGIAAWVIRPNGQLHATLIELQADALFRLISDARKALGVSDGMSRGLEVLDIDNSGAAKYQSAFMELDKLLIAPLAKHLPDNPDEPLVIIPHDILYVFPFSCLMDAQKRYLVNRYQLTTAPGVGILKFTRARIREQFNRDKPWLLLMGNPQMPDKIWPQLYGAEKEVRVIAERVNQSGGLGLQESGAQSLKALALTGADATEAEFRQIAGVQNYLHFATHGYQVRDPMRCGLILGKTGDAVENNGILTTAEIFGLPLNAELVVLSACETGLGHISSDGLAGLGMSFLYAGASSMMVSLWKVPDEATQYLMVKFYEELAKDGNKARSLQAAQLHALDKYPHPRDWAAFTLVGQIK